MVGRQRLDVAGRLGSRLRDVKEVRRRGQLGLLDRYLVGGPRAQKSGLGLDRLVWLEEQYKKTMN